MELRKYVEENGGQTEFARRLGVSQGLVWQWLNEKTGVTWERAKEIEAATGGAVTRHELRPDIFGPAPAERAA
jgi:DNA-binding transcriptional regulator YdaS (Cro superfamily)